MSDPPVAPVLPVCDEDALPFYEWTARGELRIQRCVDTGRWIFPPRPSSPYGAHRPPRWERVSGRGTLWSFVVPHPPLLPAFAPLAPYAVAVVALAEDPTLRLVGNLVARPGGAIDEVDPASIRIGMPLRAVLETVGSDETTFALPRWMREEAPGAD